MKVTVQDIEEALFELAPRHLAEEWDNVGLQCGDPGALVKRAVVTLDVTNDVLAFCLKQDAQLAISHHPLIFTPLRCLNLKDYTARLLAGFLRHDIAVLAMHTNLDSCIGGVNDKLCSLLGLQDTSPLLPNATDPSAGLGRIGLLPEPMSQDDFLELVRTSLGLDTLGFAGSAKGPIRKVAVCSGSGSTLTGQALSAGADAFVTAEIKHSEARRAEGCDLLLVDGGHFSTERPVVSEVEDYLSRVADRNGWEFEILVFEGESSPMSLWPGRE